MWVWWAWYGDTRWLFRVFLGCVYLSVCLSVFCLCVCLCVRVCKSHATYVMMSTATVWQARPSPIVRPQHRAPGVFHAHAPAAPWRRQPCRALCGDASDPPSGWGKRRDGRRGCCCKGRGRRECQAQGARRGKGPAGSRRRRRRHQCSRAHIECLRSGLYRWPFPGTNETCFPCSHALLRDMWRRR